MNKWPTSKSGPWIAKVAKRRGALICVFLVSAPNLKARTGDELWDIAATSDAAQFVGFGAECADCHKVFVREETRAQQVCWRCTIKRREVERAKARTNPPAK